MTPLELIEKKRQELQTQLLHAQADVYAMQGALQVLDELEKELVSDENQIPE
jgi:hypothetical protein